MRYYVDLTAFDESDSIRDDFDNITDARALFDELKSNFNPDLHIYLAFTASDPSEYNPKERMIDHVSL